MQFQLISATVTSGHVVAYYLKMPDTAIFAKGIVTQRYPS